MNNKGFAVSGVLYTILLMFLALLSMLLWNFENKKSLLDKIKMEVNEVLNSQEYKVYANEYAVYKTGTTSEVSVIYYDPANGMCTESDYNNNVDKLGTTGCMKWYAIENSDKTKSTVDVILDHNTTATIAWNASNRNVAYESSNVKPAITGLGWPASLNTRIISAEEVAEITGAKTSLKWSKDKTYNSSPTDIETQSSWFYFDGSGSAYSGWQSQVATSKGASNYAWLFDNTTGCESYGCNVEDHSTAGYWTSTASTRSTYGVWRVRNEGSLADNRANGVTCGIRPVVTVSKSIVS